MTRQQAVVTIFRALEAANWNHDEAARGLYELGITATELEQYGVIPHALAKSPADAHNTRAHTT